MTGFVGALTLFVLALVVGFEIVQRASPSLHAPLLSGSSALSGLVLIGALMLAGDPGASTPVRLLATVAIAFATLNVVGGFVATHRMLALFKKSAQAPEAES